MVTIKPKKICFIQHAGEFPFIKMLAEQLRENGMETVFVCKSPDTHRQYSDAGFESYLISEIFNKKNQLTDSEIEAIDQKYGLPGIQSIAESDVHMGSLFGNDDKAKHQIIGRAYIFWEKFFIEKNIDYILSREIATFSTRSAYNVSRYLGIPSAQLAIGPGKGYFMLSDMSQSSMWTELLDYISEGERSLSAIEQKQVSDFINERLPKTGNQMKVNFVNFSIWRNLKNLFGLFLKDTDSEMKRDPIRIASLRYGRYWLKKRIIWKYFVSNFFDYNEAENEKFVYFPLYSGNETGYLVDDHYWAQNEFSLIVEVAKNLPAGVYLYVKEHPLNPGYLSWKELIALKKYQNIRVLKPSVSSQSLIEKSELVFVLQGTAGWEAFLSRKPVISLGASFFSYSELVYKIKNISDLPSILYRSLKEGEKIYDKRDNAWKWFINGVISTCGCGEVVNSNPPPDFPTSKENAKKVANFLTTKIKKDLMKANQKQP